MSGGWKKPKPHGPKEHIERRLRRRSGMSADKQAAMHAANDSQLWRVKCRACGEYTTGLKTQLIACSHCGTSFKQ